VVGFCIDAAYGRNAMTPDMERDFEMLHRAWGKVSVIFGASMYDIGTAIETQIWSEMFRLFKPYGGLRERYITKAQRALLDQTFSLRVTNLGRPFWVVFKPYERTDTKRPEMGFKARRIVSVTTPRGVFHIFPLCDNRVVSVKGHAIRRILERTPAQTEAEAIAAVSDVLFRREMEDVTFSEEDIPIDIPLERYGGVLKGVNVTVVLNSSVTESHKMLHSMVNTYYPPSFLEAQ
jgi:hypothetical protein